jgi:hypothetical protein
MPGIPMEVLAEQIEATNRRLADEVHALGDRIDQAERRMADKVEQAEQRMGDRIDQAERRMADKIEQAEQRMGSKIEQVERRLDDFRVEVATELGKINTTLEAIRVRVDGAISIGRWTAGVLVPIVITLVGAGFWLTWHAAKLDSRVERIEKAVGAAEKPGAARR